MERRYVVEGAWADGNDGWCPITMDWVVARTSKEAKKMVSEAREGIDGWYFDRVQTFGQHFQWELKRLARMERASLEDIKSKWKQTLVDLGYENGVVGKEEDEDGED